MKQEPTFLVCGEALMDVFAADPRVPGAPSVARVGGSPFNVAIGLARLAQPVAFLGGLSSDTMGMTLLRALEREGVDVSLVARSDAPTTQSLVGVDASGHPTYDFRGEDAADRQLQLHDLARVPEVQVIHVGSYAMVVEPIATTLRTLIDQRHDRTVIAWDPNVRPAVVADPTRWAALCEWMMPRTHVLKLSVEDLAWLSPGSRTESFARHAIEKGVRLVVVTMGAEGARAFTRHAGVVVRAPYVNVVDTVGAGDSVQAAMLSYLAERCCLDAHSLSSLDHEALLALLTFALQAAALTCSRQGAELPHRVDLNT